MREPRERRVLIRSVVQFSMAKHELVDICHKRKHYEWLFSVVHDRLHPLANGIGEKFEPTRSKLDAVSLW